MCGIIGYTGNKEATPILLKGLSQLEYRGYDSSGIAVSNGETGVSVRKASGKLESLVSNIRHDYPSGNLGIGHTRWATHGKNTENNAHPHGDCTGNILVVHNGIVENHSALKDELNKNGHTFVSETDSEVIPHLIEAILQSDCTLEEATLMAARQLEGSQAIVVMSKSEPEKLLALRIGNAGGITVGYGEDEVVIASDMTAIIPHTKKVNFLSDGEMVSTTPSNTKFFTLNGEEFNKTPQTLSYDPVSIARGGFKHFMLKEIHEQPESIISTLRGRVIFGSSNILLEEIPLDKKTLRDMNRVVLVAMGTSFHAALVGQHMIEQLSGIPATAENASEFRNRNPIIDEKTLVISISQSGETTDTLLAMETALNNKATVLTISNVEESQASRLAQGNIYLRSGPEIGVASTKTFTCSMEALYILSAYLGRQNGFLSEEMLREKLMDLEKLPDKLGRITSGSKSYIKLAEIYHDTSNFLYLGRGINYPIALEGALKLKEISYIHAEGFPAGEIKHGPIALIDENIPVVAIVTSGKMREKMVNNIHEVKTRGGKIIAIATEGDEEIETLADHTIYIPDATEMLTPLLTTIPLQLLAYHIAVKRGCDVDQPRNLAKTVTVE
ncbi:MAG: glutamine--fructose-6-phosphate transaminase (isomerizing) [SAR202 cluster bacterium]|nr:glutamine--fructose-6-phosphate transaminase (isomerizing) [SAR202 cluster bacterium]